MSLFHLIEVCVSIRDKLDNDQTGAVIFLMSQAIRSFYLIKPSTEKFENDVDRESLLPLLQ